jgi:DNA gyrase subunit A
LDSILSLTSGERITSAVAVSSFEQESSLVLFTHQGKVKRMALSEIGGVQRRGLVAIRLAKGDLLGWVDLMSGDEDLIAVTQQGQALRFSGDAVRVMGRAAGGVNGIKLDASDRVCSAGVISDEQAELLIVTAKGYGKRMRMDEFATKGRYGKGVRCLGGKLEQTGVIAAARVAQSGDQVNIISKSGMVLRTSVEDIPQMGRGSRGSKVMELGQDDEVRSVAVIGNGG